MGRTRAARPRRREQPPSSRRRRPRAPSLRPTGAPEHATWRGDGERRRAGAPARQRSRRASASSAPSRNARSAGRPGIGEQHLAAEPWEQLEQRLDVPPLVERRPRRRTSGHGPRSASAPGLSHAASCVRARRRFERRSARRTPSASADQSRGEHIGAPERGDELGSARPQPSSSTRLPSSSRSAERRARARRARPQLGPVGQELLPLERLLVDQLLGVRRVQRA